MCCQQQTNLRGCDRSEPSKQKPNGQKCKLWLVCALSAKLQYVLQGFAAPSGHKGGGRDPPRGGLAPWIVLLQKPAENIC